MDPRTTPNKRLDKRVRVDATSDAIAGLMHSDPAKVKVMRHFRKLVADGFAEWQTLDDGIIRLRLITGETYLLEPATVTRIA
jgi:predicted ATP-binding protein involved in virulence